MSTREFELDLTSVCVGSGVVQLPLKMQPLFAAGDLPAVVDGEQLLLTFIEPRRLAGFKEHFERRGLRCNDRVRFEVEVNGERAVALVAASIKRERSKPVQPRAAQDAGETDDRASGVPIGSSAPYTATSSWGSGDTGGQVRAVRRVRVEGGAPSPVSPATQSFASPTALPRTGRHGSAPQGAAEPQYASWTPLDGLTPETDRQPLGQRDYPETTVREIRRNRAQPDPVQDLHLADHVGEPPSSRVEEDYPPLYSYGSEVIDQVTNNPPEAQRSAAAIAAEQAVGETVTTHAMRHGFVTPRIPVPRNTAAGSTWQPTPAPGMSPSEPTTHTHQPRLIEERELDAARSAGRAAAPYGQLTFEETPGQSDERSAPEPPTSRPTVAPRAIDDAEFGGEYLPSGRPLETALRSKAEAAGQVPPPPAAAGAGPSSVPGPAAPVYGSSTTGANPEPAAEPRPAVAPRLEDDLRMVEAYLSRPNTPAIVRSEVVAAELGIGDQRSERALERLSENRDKISRIRKGAYMVKSSPAGHTTRL